MTQAHEPNLQLPLHRFVTRVRYIFVRGSDIVFLRGPDIDLIFVRLSGIVFYEGLILLILNFYKGLILFLPGADIDCTRV